MQELKPCPFCGAMPQCGVDFYESFGGEVKLAATVECTGCGISKRVVFKATNPISHVSFIDYKNAFDSVIKNWNRRTNNG